MSESAKRTPSDADRALQAIMPMCAKFQERFARAIQARETGFVTLRIDYDRGRVTMMEVQARDGERIRPQDALDAHDPSGLDS